MKARILLLMLALLTAAPSADAQMPGSSDAFQLSAVQASDDSGKVYIDLKLDVKYTRLVFFREQERYRADYRIYLQFFGDEGEMVRGDVFSGEVWARDYSETRSSGRELNISRQVYLEPGDYRIKAAVEVVGTRIRYKRETSISLSESDIFISIPVFYISPAGKKEGRPPAGEVLLITAPPDRGRFSRRDSGVYTDPQSWIRAKVTISAPASPGKVEIYVRIVNMSNETVSYNRGSFSPASGKTVRLNVDINVDDYQPGSYRLAVHASDGKEKSGTSNDFVVLFNREFLTGNFQEALDLISLMVPDKDLSALAESSPSGRIRAWREFWSGADGRARLKELREKIAYTARNFSGSRPGWESDMGRIYIRNGKPDRSVTRWSRWGGERYNFWYYYSLGIVYVFVDNFGTGDYRLIDTRNI
ncbi:MAG: GWxTD domain-containing protein [Candidatus Latescibacteria bacterium]|nr:GWxTD domain-containing protein [bacterium]MBD3425354.1 GWxTD domain-containing protein [Candidatus Latescibacterota bacterium]